MRPEVLCVICAAVVIGLYFLWFFVFEGETPIQRILSFVIRCIFWCSIGFLVLFLLGSQFSGSGNARYSDDDDGSADLYESAYYDGYNDGYVDGYVDGYSSGSEDSYAEFYDEGYQDGYAEGSAAASLP